jgi:hypothetical protein
MTQSVSQVTEQQKESIGQTHVMHGDESQPGLPCTWQQVDGQAPQSAGHEAQPSPDSQQPSPQVPSHGGVQSAGQLASVSPVPQVPLPHSSMQAQALLHVPAAEATQTASQDTVQQKLSSGQTHSMHPAVSQPGVSCGSQHEPGHAPQSAGQEIQLSLPSQQPSPQDPSHGGAQSAGQLASVSPVPQVPLPHSSMHSQAPLHVLAAAITQVESQETLQQKLSSGQTHAMQPTVSQPAVPCGSQQEPGQAPQSDAQSMQLSPPSQQPSPHPPAHAGAQSSGQPEASSPSSQAPSPQVGPQSYAQPTASSPASQVPLPQIGAHEQTPAQYSLAASPHALSHWLSQQKGSSLQTQASHGFSSQPGVPLNSQQAPVHAPQSLLQVLQLSAAEQQPSPHWLQSMGQLAQSSLGAQRPSPQIGAQPQAAAHPAPRQTPSAPPPPTAQLAQPASHEALQQNGSFAHTQSVQDGAALQPADPFAEGWQQLPHAPQSTSQVAQASPGSHVPLPHDVSQDGQAPTHSVAAIAAQVPSQSA